MADSDSWDADNFEPNEPLKRAAGLKDRWEGEDEEDDVKDNWDDEEEEEEEQKVEEKKIEVKVPEKKKLAAKIKEKENAKLEKQQELRQQIQESQSDLSPEQQAAEKLHLQKLQEESDMALAREAFRTSGIEAMCPVTKEDFVVFERSLRDKITQYEKSVHYANFLESLFRELCISVEVDDLKKITNSLSVLLTEKQKQEKEKAKGTKKKKKTVLAGGGLKAKMKDDFDDFGGFDGGYNEYEDFM